MRSLSRSAIFTGILPAAMLAASAAGAATVATFTGGDPGEGLDLEGIFTYAVNVGPSGPAGRAGDANFTADNIAGVSVTANNEIANGGWGNANYGDSDADQALSYAMNSIRWAGAPETVVVTLAVEAGVEYKLQLLFRENCCPGRGFNVVLDGNLEVANFMPGPVQTGDGIFEEQRDIMGAVITHQFVSSGTEYEIILDGPSADSPDITDRNAILNAFTLERITPVADSDNDGLRDDWELQNFGDLSQTGSGDPDNDQLTNEDELTAATDPNNPDTDGDGLTDGAEVNVHHTDPLRAGDADGDRISDGAEITIYGTDPQKADTDDDGFDDYYEVRLMTDGTDPDSKPRNTLITVFTGPDPDQGLDFQGEFIYAINAANEDEAGQLYDAYFTADSVEGVSLLASQVANGWNVGVNYGEETIEQLVLTLVMTSIRWSDAANATTPFVSLTFSNLQVGASYKMQLLFSEYQWPRGFDVSINGRHVVDDFSPYQWQGGVLPTSRSNGVVITHTFVATSPTITTVLDGRTVTSPEMTDHNAILQGATLELLAANEDSDGDSLSDHWEREYFPDLSQDGTSDPDSDGLTNAQEFASGTDPTVADTDGDGLSDGEEVNEHNSNPLAADGDGDGLNDAVEIQTHMTDPAKADTDDDGLNDGVEVTTHGTNPRAADTDGDGLDDGVEVNYFLDPLKAEQPTVFSNITVGGMYGGDPDEGLDLQGEFKYAFNVSSAGAAGRAGDAEFTAEDAPGITVVAQNDIPSWAVLEYGDTPADDTLEKVMGSIRWSPAPQRWRVELANLIPGSRYKLQVLVWEQCCDGRGFNIVADGVTLVENFMPGFVQNGAGNIYEGSVVSAEFTTYRDRLVVIGDGPAATSPDITDRNATLSGMTLEIIEEAEQLALSVERSEGGLVITFEGTLQSADSVTGPYTDVPGTSPMTIPTTDSAKFYRSIQR